MKQILTPKQVARAIGASEASLKRWCDKGLLPAVRTAGGHRRLPISGVLKFIRERGQALIRPEVLGLPATSGRGDSTIARGRDRIRDALIAGDGDCFRAAAFDLYLAGNSACSICDYVLAPIFVELGTKWQHGNLQVYQERRGVEICMQWLYEIRTALPLIGDGAPYALGGSLESDPYTLPTTMAEVVLREAGWRAESYGPGHPIETLLAAVADKKPQLIWVSFSTLDPTEEFLSHWAELYLAASKNNVALAVGGRALTGEIRRTIGFSSFCDDMSHLVAFARSVHPRD